MRRLLKFTNYAAQLMALIDIGKQAKHTPNESAAFTLLCCLIHRGISIMSIDW